MINLVRTGVFETNSSSCHTVSVGNSGVYKGITPNVDGSIMLEPMEFGWEQETHDSPEARLNYVMLYIRDYSKDKEVFQKLLEGVVFEHTGATSLGFVNSEKPPIWGDAGYIDHQSAEDGMLDHLFGDAQRLKDFIFDRTSYIKTDNDNH